MDPNANLKEQSEILSEIKTYAAPEHRAILRARLKELRIALCQWLRNGGFAPEWKAFPKASAAMGVKLTTIYCLVDEKGKVVSRVYTQKRNIIAAQRRMPAYDAIKAVCPCDLSRIKELGEVIASRRIF